MSRLSQGCRKASSKRAWGSGIREQHTSILRCVANRSSVGDPHLRSRSLATCEWSDHSAPRTWLQRLSRSARTLDCPGRYLASSWTLLDSVHRRSCPVNEQRESETVPPFVHIGDYSRIVAHRCHSVVGD